MIDVKMSTVKNWNYVVSRSCRFRCGSKTRARNGDGTWCGRMVATPVATSAVPERRCPPAPATLRTSGRPPAYSATATACPRPRWRSYTPFIIFTQASPLRSPSPTSTDDGLKWKRTPTVASPAILDEGSSRFLVNRGGTRQVDDARPPRS